MAIFGKKNNSNKTPRRRQMQAEEREKDIQEMTRGKELFRRNRTLTGSSSASVSSANELDSDLRSPRAKAHHLAAHRRRLTGVLVSVLAVTIMLSVLVYEFTARTYPVASTAAVSLQQDRYQQILDEYFSTRPIERLRSLINHEELNNFVKSKAPEVARVTADGSAGFAASRFVLDMRKPLAGWLIGSSHQYVDRYGVVFALNYFDEPAVKIVDESGIPQINGTASVSSRFLSFVGRSVVAAREYGLEIVEAIIPKGTTRQIELRVEGRDYPIRLSLDRPVGEQIEDMQHVVRYFDQKGGVPEYVDVRVSGRVYYQDR